MENNDTTPAPIGPSKQSHDALKAVMLVVLFLCTFLVSTASLPFRNFVRARATTSPYIGIMFSLVSCFGAGVFLATCLLDMLPDAQKSMAQAERRLWGPTPSSFPLCAMFISVGFLLVLLLEHVAHCAIEWLGGGGGAASFFGGQHRQHQAVPVQQQLGPQQQFSRRDSQQEQLLESSLPAPMDNDNGAVDDQSQRRQQQQQDENGQEIPAQQQEERHYLHQHADEIGSTESINNNSNNNIRRCDFDVSTLRVLLLLLALNLHACCEGISIGTFTDVSVLFQIFIALLIHKSIVGFSLGIRLVQSNLCAPFIVLCCVLFAIQVLIGGFISLAIMDLLAGTASVFMLAAIAQAIACGTFLYITTMEILPHELSSSSTVSDHHQHDGMATTMSVVVRSQKVAALLAGFLLISVFVAIFPDADDANGIGIISR